MPKHYAISDIHGMYNIYEQVKAMLKPDDIVYFLGDAGDRGYEGFKCIKEIYNDPQWIYLKGNHEDMMVKALLGSIDSYTGYMDEDNMQIWMHNGGYDTLCAWAEESNNLEWAGVLDKLPLTAEYTNPKGITFHMSHAGFTCGHKDQLWGDELLWNRRHFFNSWDEEAYPKDICIHGHTPIPYMIESLWEAGITSDYYKNGCPEAREYCDGHKINIDNGVFYTGATVLYDLDEMVAIPLKDQKFKEGWSWKTHGKIQK